MATYKCCTMMMIDVTYTKKKPWTWRKKICAPTTITPPFCLHKRRPWIEGKTSTGTYHIVTTTQWQSILLIQMRPWTIGKKIMGTYQCMTIAPWWWSIMLIPTQNENMNKRKIIMGIYYHCMTIMIDDT
jgi:hypothetical protein